MARFEPDARIELIPFAETQNYVKINLRNYEIYRRLYGHSVLFLHDTTTGPSVFDTLALLGEDRGKERDSR